LASLLFEGSLQAQLVQPLAVTLIFGLLFSPFLVLFLVPALIGIGADLRVRFGGGVVTPAGSVGSPG
jgi:multidrug efflux pump subunit AcrB